MNDKLKNIPASIHARLTVIARKQKRPFQEVLQHYGMERFLYRLSKTKYANSFILKGGLIFTIWGLPLRRPTKDIDFLGLIDNSKDSMVEVLKAAIDVEVPEDGVIFDVSTISVEKTQVNADRAGIRARFLGYLGKTEIHIKIDIGFSDELSLTISNQHYPTFFSDMAGPVLKGYPPEAVIAEKFHAMEHFKDLPSRWKDYYDIWLISANLEFDDVSLRKAIVKTFEDRKTKIPVERPVSMTIEFASSGHNRDDWRNFLKENNLENSEINELAVLVEKLWSFLEWPLTGLLATPDIVKYRKKWQHISRKWEIYKPPPQAG